MIFHFQLHMVQLKTVNMGCAKNNVSMYKIEQWHVLSEF